MYSRQRWGHLIQVKITLDPLTQRTVHVAPGAFSAHLGKVGEAYRLAASAAAMAALQDAEAGGLVTILEVLFSPDHDRPEDVGEVTSLAVRKVLSR